MDPSDESRLRAPSELIDPRRLQSSLVELSRFGKDPHGGTSRIAFSTEDRAAREWVMAGMREAGLEVWVDDAANIHGRRAGADPQAPVILFGSHIDTVPRGGDFDGCLGSLGALEVLRALEEHGVETRHALEMVIWSDEEGVHFGTGFFGSRAATRGIDRDELRAEDGQGVSQAEWLRRYGQDPDRIETARREPGRLAAYLELHVEQGPFLYREGVRIGVVQGIVGIRRYHVTIEGFANHAGTTPMVDRKDALFAAAQLTQAVREEVTAKPGRQVGNVGFIKTLPGAPNVVPGLVRMPIELRDLDRAVVEDLEARIERRAQAIARANDVSIRFDLAGREDPSLTDAGIQDVIEAVARQSRLSTVRMPSGAGHDAQLLASFGVPTGMIFVPSKDGVSHAPGEWTDGEDCARGVDVLYQTIRKLDGDL